MQKIVSKNFHREDSQTLSVYEANGGYAGLKKALACYGTSYWVVSVEYSDSGDWRRHPKKSTDGPRRLVEPR